MNHAADTILTLDDAIQAHNVWKTRFKVAMLKQQLLDGDVISRDDCCALGKWIYGEGSEAFGSNALFTRLADRHHDFHLEAGKIALLINARRNSKAITSLGSASPFTKASGDVVSAIEDLKLCISQLQFDQSGRAEDLEDRTAKLRE